MKEVDSLLHARWIVPILPRNTILENHSIAITNGRILDILPTQEARSKYQSENEQTLSEHALLPGLINMHAHSAMTLLRGLADDLPLMTWLEEHIWPAEQKWVSKDFVRDGTKLAIAEMLKGGTTCFNDMYFYPDVAAEVAIETGMRATIGIVVFDFPCSWGEGPDDYFKKGKQAIDAYRQHDLIDFTIDPHAPYTVSDENLIKCMQYRDEWNCRINMHVHETQHEVDEALAKTDVRPLERLDKLGMLDERFIAVHMTALTDEEIALCAERNIHITTCPHSNLKLASGFCPVAKLLDNNVNVTVGTDGAASNNDLDMLDETKTTAFLAKGVAQNPTVCDATTALEMATINGAKALGLEHEIGSITVDKKADLIAVDLNHLSTQPLYHVVSQVMYATSRHQVSDVWVSGKQLLKDYELTTIDEVALLETAKSWQQKLKDNA